VRRIVVVKPAALGDLLQATPALEALRRAYPSAHITLAVGTWSRTAVEGNPDVDELLDCGSFGTPGRYGLRDVWRFSRQVRRAAYDLAVVLDRSPKVALAPWLAGIPHRAGIDSSGRGFALTLRVPWNRPRHEAELMLDVVRALGVIIEPLPHTKFLPSDDSRRFAERLLQEWGLAGETPIVVVHPGGASNPGKVMPEKRWPAPRFAALADGLVDQVGARIVIVGHGADQPLARQMRLAMRHPSVDLVGQTSISQLAGLLERCHLYVGNDSAPLHLATAVGTPVLGIFGPTDPAIYGPYRAAGALLVHHDACSQRRPFVPGPVSSCANCRCIDLISVEEALAAARQAVEASAAPDQTRKPA
jgi:lipopolysaccharide heptosyltransferase II